MIVPLLITLLLVQFIILIYIINKLNLSVRSENELKVTIQSLNNEIEAVNNTLEKTDKDKKNAVLLTYSLNEKIAKMKSNFNEQMHSLSLEHNNKIHQLQQNLKNEKQEYNKPSDTFQTGSISTDNNLDLIDGAESFAGERDGLRFQDEALDDYEGGTWDDNEYSEMGHDGDDY